MAERKVYPIPGGSQVRDLVTAYVTHSIRVDSETQRSFKESFQFKDNKASMAWFPSTMRGQGSNCGQRDFGNMSCFMDCIDVPIRHELLTLVAWLPMCSNPYNYPYAKFTSFGYNSADTFSLRSKEGRDALRKWGWKIFKIPAAAHAYRENYDIYYLSFFMKRADVYVLRGMEEGVDERSVQVRDLKEWIESITTANPITWIPTY